MPVLHMTGHSPEVLANINCCLEAITSGFNRKSKSSADMTCHSLNLTGINQYERPLLSIIWSEAGLSILHYGQKVLNQPQKPILHGLHWKVQCHVECQRKTKLQYS